MQTNYKKYLTRILTNQFCGDKANADSKHCGQIAGFTNIKEIHCKNNFYPFINSIFYKGQHAILTKKIKDIVVNMKNVDNYELNINQKKHLIQTIKKGKILESTEKKFELCWNEWHLSMKLDDYSIEDFAVCSKMIKMVYSIYAIIQVLFNKSPNFKERKRNHELNYARRTVFAAKRFVK
jgi:hypothetical protein